MIETKGLSESVEIKATGCHGFCAMAPVLVIEPEGIFYHGMREEDVENILDVEEGTEQGFLDRDVDSIKVV